MLSRRDFFKMTSLAGLSLCLPAIPSLKAAAYEGPYWIMINANGGWDPTSLCDPKGRASEDEEEPVNRYFNYEIGSVGPFRYAPFAGHKEFFEKYASQLLVINGIDVGTNSHDTGRRHTWSGKSEGAYPALGAVIAGAYAPEKPMSFLSNGGYDHTANLVAPSRSANQDNLERLSQYNRPRINDERYQYHLDETETLMDQMLAERSQNELKKTTLPSERTKRSTLFMASTQDSDINLVKNYLPAEDISTNAVYQQAKLGLAAYKANLSISMTVNRGGFDTHGNHDASHVPRLSEILTGIDHIMQEAERMEIADKVVIVVGSDFGRTPSYNANNGKDHWPITSMMLMGNGIPGNRVVGKTTNKHEAIPLNVETFEPDEVNGQSLTPADVHFYLRKLAGVEAATANQQFPIAESGFPDFITSTEYQTAQEVPPEAPPTGD